MPNTPNSLIEVPICNDCNKPHFGRKNVDDRCVCDTCGNYHMGLIPVEVEEPNSLIDRNELNLEEKERHYNQGFVEACKWAILLLGYKHYNKVIEMLACKVEELQIIKTKKDEQENKRFS